MTCEVTAENPTNETEEGSQTPSFHIQTDIKHGVDQGNQEPNIQRQNNIVPDQRNLDAGEIEWRRHKVENDQSREENWPNKKGVDGYVDWIAMISPVKGEVPLQIKQPSFPHRERSSGISSNLR